MTTKRTKGLASLDLVLPVAPYYRTDPQVLKDVEALRTRAASRWAKEDQFATSQTFPLTQNKQTNDLLSTMNTLSRPKLEILRANSPTLKRLLAVRVKLEKYVGTITRISSASRQSMHLLRETPFQPIPEKQPSTAPATIIQPTKQASSQLSQNKGPLDKITYEKLWTRNGNVRQKCSLEIWLPKADSNEDDGSIDCTPSLTPDVLLPAPPSPKPVSIIKSRRSSIAKIATTTTISMESKSVDDVSSKKSDPVLVPRVYHYEEYLTDPPEERPRSSKSGTVKSETGGSIKNAFRQRTRPHTRRPSASTVHTEDTLQSGTTAPISAQVPSKNIKPTSAGSTHKPASTFNNNASMISELMRKYSLMKKNHQEMTQAKLQLEKPHSDTKVNGYSPRDHSPSRAPITDTNQLAPSDRPTISVKKLLVDATPTSRPTTEHGLHSGKLLDRRGHRKSHQPDITAKSPVQHLSATNQHRTSSASVPVALLPSVNSKKNDETIRILQRSKTLDVIFDVPTGTAITVPNPNVSDNPSPPSNLFQRAATGTVTIEQTTSRPMKRSTQTPLLSLRPDQQPQQPITPVVQLLQYHNVQKSAQRYHYNNHSSSTVGPANNKVMVHLKYSNSGNTDRNCLVPD